MSNSPCPGVTLRRLASGIPVVRVHYSADPEMTPGRIAELRKTMNDARWRREMEIEYEALEGERFYPEYLAEVNDVEPFDITDQNQWTVWMACDPHMRTPHAFVWVAFNEDGTAVICGELWPPQNWRTNDYALWVKFVESDSEGKPPHWWPGKRIKVYKRVMDTHGKAANSDEGEDYFKTYRSHGLHFYPAKKSHDAIGAARDLIGRMLRPDRVMVDGEERWLPWLYVFRNCTEARAQFENVRFPAVDLGEVSRLGEEKPETYRKHILDGLHYIFAERPKFVHQHSGSGDTFKPIYADIGY